MGRRPGLSRTLPPPLRRHGCGADLQWRNLCGGNPDRPPRTNGRPPTGVGHAVGGLFLSWSNVDHRAAGGVGSSGGAGHHSYGPARPGGPLREAWVDRRRDHRHLRLRVGQRRTTNGRDTGNRVRGGHHAGRRPLLALADTSSRSTPGSDWWSRRAHPSRVGALPASGDGRGPRPGRPSLAGTPHPVRHLRPHRDSPVPPVVRPQHDGFRDAGPVLQRDGDRPGPIQLRRHLLRIGPRLLESGLRSTYPLRNGRPPTW